MAEDETDEEGLDKQSLEKIQKSIKTNRILFFSQLGLMSLILCVLITAVVVINMQMSNRREVPAEEFAEQLTLLEAHLDHLTALHNSEAQVYFDFQDTLVAVREAYSQDNINELRGQLLDRERDHRKLLQLIEENASSLATMISGSRDWTGSYSSKVKNAIKLSQQRESEIKESMAAVLEEEKLQQKTPKK